MAAKEDSRAALEVSDDEAKFSNDEFEDEEDEEERRHNKYMSMFRDKRPLQPHLKKITQDYGSVVSVISPDDFCFLREDDKPKMDALQLEIDKTCNPPHLHSPPAGKLKPHEFCFAYSAAIGAWCRAEFIHLNKGKERNMAIASISIAKAFTVQVYLLDYHYNDEVYSMNLRDRVQRDDLFNFKKYPILRLQCHLVGVRPREGSNWSIEAINSFKSLVLNRRFKLKCKELQNETYYCGLEYFINHVSGNAALTDIMVFRDIACYNATNTRNVRFLADPIKTFSPVTLPRVGAAISVVSVHVENPDLFYVYTTEQEKKCVETQVKLQKRYDKLADDPDFHVLFPKLGMPCVSIFHLDQCYYRSVIVKIENSQCVKVRYIDYGNEELVKLEDLFLLVDDFLFPEALAIPCRLDGIKPAKNSRVWSPEAKTAMEEVMSSDLNPEQPLQMEVLAHEGSKCVVNLKRWNSKDSTFVVVKDTLIASGEAVPDNTTDAIATSALNIDSYTTLCDIIERNSRASNSRLKSLIPVKVTNVESPDSFHVRIVDKTLDDYYVEMAARIKKCMEYYASKCQRATEFQVKYEKNGICAFFMDSAIGGDRVWHRGEVVERLPTADELTKEEQREYRVYGVDTGRMEVVKRDQIFQLPLEYRSHKPYAFKCRLIGLKPTGNDTWTKTAISRMQDLVTDRSTTTYILSRKILKRLEKPDVIEVDLVGKEEKIIGAFDPKTLIYYSFNHKLIDEGLAIPATADAGRHNQIVESELNNPTLRREPAIPDTIELNSQNPGSDNSKYIRQQALIKAPEIMHLDRRNKLPAKSGIPFLSESDERAPRNIPARQAPEELDVESAFDLIRINNPRLAENDDYDLYGPEPGPSNK